MGSQFKLAWNMGRKEGCKEGIKRSISYIEKLFAKEEEYIGTPFSDWQRLRVYNEVIKELESLLD